MPIRQQNVDELRRLQNVKARPAQSASALGEEMIQFYKQSVVKRQTKLSQIAESWGQLVPESLCDHCALESYQRGSLTVLVDTAPHLYELKQLLLAGIEQQLKLACRSTGLRKISLKAGRWYGPREDPRERSARFKQD